MSVIKRYVSLKTYIHLIWPLVALAFLYGLFVFLINANLLDLIPPQDLNTMPADSKQRYLQAVAASQVTIPIYLALLLVTVAGGIASYIIVAKRMLKI